MSKSQRPCPICSLGEELVDSVNRQLVQGVSQGEIVSFLGRQGHKITERQVTTHKRHAELSYSPVTHVDEVKEILRTATQDVLRPNMTPLEMEALLLSWFMGVGQDLFKDFKEHGSIRTARVIAEIGHESHAILKAQIDRGAVDQSININIQDMRLEDLLAKGEMH